MSAFKGIKVTRVSPDVWEYVIEIEDERGGKTRLTFTQSGFTTPRPPYAAWMGTLAGFASLRRFVEFDPWRPIYAAAA